MLDETDRLTNRNIELYIKVVPSDTDFSDILPRRLMSGLRHMELILVPNPPFIETCDSYYSRNSRIPPLLAFTSLTYFVVRHELPFPQDQSNFGLAQDDLLKLFDSKTTRLRLTKWTFDVARHHHILPSCSILGIVTFTFWPRGQKHYRSGIHVVRLSPPVQTLFLDLRTADIQKQDWYHLDCDSKRREDLKSREDVAKAWCLYLTDY